MSTSLAEQLRKLALPESAQQADKKKKASILFDPSEAAKLDRDAFYEIGVDGLNGLIELEPAFQIFSDTLFDLSSRYLERTVESKDLNKKLDKNISKFLRLLSPYFLLKQSHKVLEWLICRYHIQDFNVDDLFGLILPYHETKIFVKILQLINLNSPYCAHWKWLHDIKRQGIHLPKLVLVNHAISNSSFLRFICDITVKTIKENQKHDSANKLGTLITFYSTTLVSILSRETIDNHQLTIILPSFIKSLMSTSTDWKAAGYMIAGQLVSSNQVSKVLIDEILNLSLKGDEVLKREKTLLMLLIFQTQKPPPDIPHSHLPNISWMVKELIHLASEKVQVGPLVLKITESCLRYITESNENLVDAQVLSYTIATEITCDLEHCKSLIWMIDSCYNRLNDLSKSKSSTNDPGVLLWVKELMNATVEKYRHILDNDQSDEQFKKLRERWKTADELALQEKVLVDLMKKCQDDSKESAWLQLRPQLLDRIEIDSIFEALLKVAPFYDNLVLLLCLEKLLKSKHSEANKLAKLSKMFKSKFGGKNPHIQEINNLMIKNKTESMTEVIENYFLKLQKDLENSIEFEPWFASLQELKQLNKFSDSNEIWNLGLKVLTAALPTPFNPTYALQLLSILASVKKGKLKIGDEIIKFIISYLRTNLKKEMAWYDLTSHDSEIWLKVRILQYLVENIYGDVKKKEVYSALLDDFSQFCFFSRQEFVRFLSAVCCGTPVFFKVNSSEFKISPLLQVYSLNVCWLQLKDNTKSVFDSFGPELATVLCYLLMILSNNSTAVRQAALKTLDALVTLLKNYGTSTDALIFVKLLERSEEISIDPNQVSVALYCLLSPCESVQAILRKSDTNNLAKTRNKLLEVINADETPLYVSLSIMQLLDSVNSSEIIEELTGLARRALLRSKESEIPNMILENFWLRINETTSQVMEKEKVWELLTESIKHEKCENQCPAVSCLKSITREVFDNLSDKRKFQLVECMIATRSETNSTATASAIASAMKKVYLDCKMILPIINQMITLFSSSLKKKENLKSQQPTIIESKGWKNGMSLLELIQSKKKLLNSNALIQPLFIVLKFCLDQEEQTTFEYTKQLVLGCLLDCCKKLSDESETSREKKLDVELVVQCLRASPNPQTHHHALMLLSYLSAIIPKQVMHNVMAIFTFMGTSVARLDDEHSVKIVTQVVDAVVPELLKAFNSENDDLQIVVAEILRVFVWAIEDIPQHRRKPLLLQLLNTLQPENSLWLFLLLLFESHVSKVLSIKKLIRFLSVKGTSKADAASTPTDQYLGLQLCLSTSPKIVLQSIAKIINYLMDLPFEMMNKDGRVQKSQWQADKDKKSDGLFDIEAHTPKQLRHFAYTILVFLNNLLMDNNFIMQVGEHSANDDKSLEEVLKETIEAIMKYTPVVRKQLDKQQTKFWKAMVHQCYEILDKFVLLVPNKMILRVVKKLLNHSVKPLRRKALDLLNTLIQNHQQEFTKREKATLTELLDPVVYIIKGIGKEIEQESVLIQQTALLTLKLLAKLLSFDDINSFKKILIQICKISTSETVEGPLLGSIMLTIAELVACLKAHSVTVLHIFMPSMLKVLNDNINSETFNELELNSITLALHKVVDVLPQFLSPFLNKILLSVCTASIRFSDKTELIKKLNQMRQKLASSLEHRILMPAVTETYTQLIKNNEFEATGPLFSTLSCSFSESSDVTKIVPDVTQLFMSALSFRSDCETENKKVSLENINLVEGNVIKALVPFVLKLSESAFKPLYYQLFHWSSEHQDRSITFFRLSTSLAENLKGLFVLFAGHFLHKAASLLDSTNLSKTESPYFGDSKKGTTKAITLLENILKTLHFIFLYDSTESSNFLNKDKFEVLLHPLVDQLENTLGGVEELEKRTSSLLTPCLAQMALATDDTLWKSLNYQILLKTKSILPQVRIGALETIVSIAIKLGDDYLMLLPETIGSLAELLEDEDERVENAMKNAIQRLEEVLGQPIRDYFQ